MPEIWSDTALTGLCAAAIACAMIGSVAWLVTQLSIRVGMACGLALLVVGGLGVHHFPHGWWGLLMWAGGMVFAGCVPLPGGTE